MRKDQTNEKILSQSKQSNKFCKQRMRYYDQKFLPKGTQSTQSMQSSQREHKKSSVLFLLKMFVYFTQFSIELSKKN